MKGQSLNISVHHSIIPIMHEVIEFSLFIKRLSGYLTSRCASALNQKKTLYHQTQLD